MSDAKEGAKPITVRNLSPGVARAIKEKARKERLSLNRAVLALLEEATGHRVAEGTGSHHDLDHLAGAWSREEADGFDTYLKEERSHIEPKDWK